MFYSFIGCIKNLTGKDYKQMIFDFSRKKRRNNVIIKARNQPFCIANNINIGYFNGNEVYPRSVKEEFKALHSWNNNCFLIKKSECVSFSKTVEEIKSKTTIVKNRMSFGNSNSFLKYEYKPEKIESQVNNFAVYELENFYIVRALLYCVSLYRLNKIASKINRDIKLEEYRNYKKVLKTEKRCR